MRSEQDTPIEDRFLCLQVLVSQKSLELVSSGLPPNRPIDTETFFVAYSYADLPLGKEFDAVFLNGKPNEGKACKSRIVAATQQWGKPFPEVPHGWRTICDIQFPDGVPSLVRDLPVVDSWHYNPGYACLSSAETWESIKTRGIHS